MIRQIIIPQQNTYTLNLPNEMIGKEIEVIAFEINESELKKPFHTKEEKLKYISQIFDGCRVDLSDFKFNRDEANDYTRD